MLARGFIDSEWSCKCACVSRRPRISCSLQPGCVWRRAGRVPHTATSSARLRISRSSSRLQLDSTGLQPRLRGATKDRLLNHSLDDWCYVVLSYTCAMYIYCGQHRLIGSGIKWSVFAILVRLCVSNIFFTLILYKHILIYSSHCAWLQAIYCFVCFCPLSKREYVLPASELTTCFVLKCH